MLFNSIEFICFFLVIASLYFFIPYRYRNGYLLLASYYFYGSWNVNYLILLIITTVSSYICGIYIGKTDHIFLKRRFITIACIINLGLLLIFKYFNFLISPFNTFFKIFGQLKLIPELNFLLPVGISFYTFQAIGYVIDVYRGKSKPEKNFTVFALYVSFFPQLVAGPIERSYHLIPQFIKDFKLDYGKITSGLYLMLWGFFQKLVIADRLAIYVNAVHEDIIRFNWLQLIVACYFFSIQIYCDFAGYSNIAIGSARILGIDLINNFNRPYFAISIKDFWRRWHISLSTWFRDYLYIPLGGNRVSFSKIYRNIMVVFLLCGLWHGAGWPFIIWGGLHGVLLCINNLWNNINKNKSETDTVIIRLLKVIATFHIVTFAWIFFRAEGLSDAFLYIKRICSMSMDNRGLTSGIPGFGQYEFFLSLFLIMVLFFLELFQSQKTFDGFVLRQKIYLRWSIAYCLLFSILVFGVFNLTTFIYFQF
ncbi:MAG: MBOAT family O-acyltransferase [bacterium]